MKEPDCLRHFVQNSRHLMWFMGAGTSRSAGLPTANDIIWNLKLKHYCAVENQDIKASDINNKAIKQRIQAFLDSRGCPPLWSAPQYSFYFELLFGDDRAAQQRYISEALSPDKISLTVGHRALAAGKRGRFLRLPCAYGAEADSAAGRPVETTRVLPSARAWSWIGVSIIAMRAVSKQSIHDDELAEREGVGNAERIGIVNSTHKIRKPPFGVLLILRHFGSQESGEGNDFRRCQGGRSRHGSAEDFGCPCLRMTVS
jgi:hypothetical protein